MPQVSVSAEKTSPPAMPAASACPAPRSRTGRFRLLGPAFGLTQEYIRRHLGIRFPVDNSRSVKELGITYRPIEQTVLDHHETWRHRRRQ